MTRCSVSPIFAANHTRGMIMYKYDFKINLFVEDILSTLAKRKKYSESSVEHFI